MNEQIFTTTQINPGPALFLTLLIPLLLISCISYFLTAYPLYRMYKLANLKNPWMAFVPVIGTFKLYNLGNFGMWVAPLLGLVALIPIIGFIVVLGFSGYITFKIVSNFGFDTPVCVFAIFFGFFVYWYIALTNRPFVGELKDKYTN